MQTDAECICCQEIDKMKEMLIELQLDKGYSDNDTPKCITQHEGFNPVCTNVYVLDTAYYGYKNQYGKQSKIFKTKER